MYFLMPTFRFIDPCRALINKLIHSSNVPSKLYFTSSSYIPSYIENVLITCRTKYINF